MINTLIKCESLKMGYGNLTVIDNLTFKVNSGDYLCIVGENGSGKTTLMKGILGLLKPISGKIEYLNNLKSREIGYIPQQTSIQKNFPASVYEIILSGCLNKRKYIPFYSKSQKKLAISNMKKLKITNLKDKSYSNLSGGQQQKVLLARALCATEKLLMLDEPVTGLDPIATADMYSTISKLNQEGITVIMVSHDVTSAVNRASHILHLNGKNSHFSTTHEYIHSDLGERFLFSGCHCDDCEYKNKSQDSTSAKGVKA